MKKTLQSGAQLEITQVPFGDAHVLFKAVSRQLKEVRLDLEADVMNTVKDAFLVLAASDEVEGALWKCMARATYNGLKVTRDTFEPEEARGDFLPVAKEVLAFSIAPFFGSLASSLTASFQASIGFLKSASAPKSQQ